MNPAIALFTEKTRGYSRKDQERILNAALLADEQSREKLHQLLGTAAILFDLKLDAVAIIAVLLRDCIAVPGAAENLAKKFDGKTLRMAEEAAKLAAFSPESKTKQEAENILKMLFAMAGDIRIILIKLAGEFHTMRTLDFFPAGERRKTARQCLDIYAPLADRLGISWIKDELEDLALKHLNRDTYMQIKEIVALKKGERSSFLNAVQERIVKEARALGLTVEAHSRAKHFYSIYQKMRRRNKAPGDLYDLFGLRILCETEDSCYILLGLVHRLWKPLDGRFKDYIARPKSNGYRSLHTTVSVPAASGGTEQDGKILEIQIRTREMHQNAEYGVAGHWLYKRGNAKTGDISVIGGLKNLYPDHLNRGPEESSPPGASQLFFEDIKRELLKDRIYVLTPLNKVVELPAGATPLDFAYAIHSAIGDHCSLARADGAIIPLGSALKNTQVVEIVTSTAAHPRLNWLRLVKTAKARSKIRSYLQRNDEAPTGAVKVKKEDVKKSAQKKKFEETRESAGEEGTAGEQGFIQHTGAPVFKVRVADEKNMMIRFAGCCKPILGDPIVGYVSRGRGIIIHRRNCGNTALIPDFAERRIETQWENTAVTIKRFRIEARKGKDLFAEIEEVVKKFRGHLIEGKLEDAGGNRLWGYFTIQMEVQDDVSKVIKHLRGIPVIHKIQGL
ncbi:MAG: HD domain-containing protein [Treponema sp.]|jgi:GTP pyrophosphokinase|nr:HD domain-containing protein [Treponema sp.]